MVPTRRAFLKQAVLLGPLVLATERAVAANPKEKTHLEWIEVFGSRQSFVLRPLASDSGFFLGLSRNDRHEWDMFCLGYFKRWQVPRELWDEADVPAAKQVAQEFALEVLRKSERAVAAMGAA